MPDPTAPVSPANEPAPRRVGVVLGMHRSGTSLVAGCLQKIGVDFGSRLMPPNPDNPRGYFEHNDVVNLHDRLLLALGRSWDDPLPLPAVWEEDSRLDPYRQQLLSIIERDFPAAPLWGLKDPRLCRLLPWWEPVWTAVRSRPLFILVRRAPQEVASSLARREDMSAPKAYLLWLRHILEAERWSRPHGRVLVNFDDFRADEAAASADILQRLGLTDPVGGSFGPLVDPDLGRPAASGNESLPGWIQRADAALLLGLAGDESGMRTALDELGLQLRDAELLLSDQAPGQAADLQNQLAASRKQARWYEEEWLKAQGRIERLRSRLDSKQKPLKRPNDPSASNENNKSNLINYKISIMRKSGVNWVNKLVRVLKIR